MRIRRPISPAYATPHEAIQYLASACDGAIRRDGHGFSSDHVQIGHELANRSRWGRKHRRSGQHLIQVYRRQLEHAGFDMARMLMQSTPSRISRKRSNSLNPAWMTDPTGVHRHRFWNGLRWTSQVEGDLV